MIKEIIDNDIAYAKIIRATYKPSDKTQFFTILKCLIAVL